MAANQAVVGVLRAMLTADTAQFDTGMAKANSTLKLVEKNTKQVGVEVQKLTPQAERMVKAFSGDKLLYSANNLVTAITKIGGATKLTEAEQAKANRTLTQAIEKYAALGQKAPPAMVALQKATAGATTETQRFGMSMTQVNSVLGAFGISLGLSSVVAFGRGLLTTADQLVKVADRTGLTTTEVQKLQYIAGQSGNSLDELTGAVSRLQNNLVTGDKGAVAAVKALGLNLEALRRATPFDQMAQIATAIAKIPDPATRAAIAIDLFGRAGAAILPTLISDFEKLGEAAPNMSDATVRALDQAGDAIGKVQMQLKVWAAESYNFLGRLFDQFVNFIRRGTAGLLDGIAGVMELQAKIPGVAALWGALGINIDAVRQKAQWFRDAADASGVALNRHEKEIRKNTGAYTEYEGAADKATAAEKKFQAVLDQLSGKSLLADARAYEAALKSIGDVQKLTAEEGETYLKLLDTLIEKYRRLGPSGAAVVAHFTTVRDQLTKTDAAALRYLENEKRTADGAAIVMEARDANARAFLASELLKIEAMEAVDAAGRTYLENEKRTADGAAVVMAGRDAIANEFLQSELRRMEALKGTKFEDPFSKWAEQGIKQRARIIEMWKGLGSQLESATLGRLGTLFFGQMGHDVEGTLRAAADEAELQFLHIKNSGKATAEELSKAFEHWREAEERANFTFGERFSQWMGGLKQTFVSILDDMLQHFVKNFLGGLLKGMSSAKLAQGLGNMLVGGGAGALLGGGGALAAGTVSNGVLVGVGAGGAAGAAPAGAAAAGGGGLLALATNPWTIGAAGAIGLGLLIAKKGLFRGGAEGININPRRDQFFGQLQAMFGGTQFEAAVKASQKAKIPGGAAERMIGAVYGADSKNEYESAQFAFVNALQAGGLKNVRGFATGGFVPPGVVQPAILHGGRFGEDIVPRTSANSGAKIELHQHYNTTFNSHAMNTEGFDRVFKNEFLPRLHFEYRLNQQGTVTVLEKALVR